MTAGTTQLVDETLPANEVRNALARAGITDKDVLDSDFVGGTGSIGAVWFLGIFSALGGLLYGLDIGAIGVVEQMKSFHKDVFPDRDPNKDLDSSVAGLITALFAVGAIVAALPPVIGFIVQKLGRSTSISFGAFVFSGGVLLQGFAQNVAMMMVGRFLGGFAAGVLTCSIPMYQGEMPPAQLRGTITSLFQLSVTLGILIAIWVGKALQDVDDGWRYMYLAMELPPGLLLALGGPIFLPQSPRWLVSKGRPQEALNALRRVRAPSDNTSYELAQMCLEHEQEVAQGTPSWGAFFSGLNVRLLGVGVVLQLLQQVCGMNMFMYYGPKIFARIFDDKAAFLFQGGTGVVNFLSTFLAMALVDRAGRMRLLQLSFMGMLLCSIVLGVIGVQCLPSNFDSGASGADTELKCGEWSKYVSAGAIFVFVINFAYGVGPVIWIVCAEIFSVKYRTQANGLTTCANWSGNFAIGLTPPILLGALGWNTMWLFTAFNLIGFVFCTVLPETKGKSLDEIEGMFQKFFRMQGKYPNTRDVSLGASLAVVAPSSA